VTLRAHRETPLRGETWATRVNPQAGQGLCAGSCSRMWGRPMADRRAAAIARREAARRLIKSVRNRTRNARLPLQLQREPPTYTAGQRRRTWLATPL